ncbi:shufflon system plasmid conjugative transfer pilus tip adhesin PilV [Hafnia paralvei]|uniref:shufflon system plasmid conjugative transfer pilus tip adhesin PilV n=1 Tax=Hafnia paralvei TaxID=546367 RepID=UPI002FDBA573
MKNKTVNRGGSQLLSMVIVMGLVAMLAPKGAEQYSNYMARKSYDVTADQFNFVQSSALQYIKDNYDTLKTQVGTNKPVYVSQDTLKQKGYLPASFGANANAQVYQLAVVANPKFAGQLQAFLLTSGGNPYDYGALRHISSGIKGLGGYVWDNNLANGAEGGWKIPLKDYSITNKKGTLVSFMPSDMIGTGTQDGDRLYRYAVNNRPELNRMHTSIDVNSNDLNNIRNANGQNANFTENVKGKNGQFSESVTAKTGTLTGALTAGTVTSKGAITGSTLTTSSDIKSTGGWITTQGNKGWMNETYGGGWYMSDSSSLRSVNNKDVYTAGQMRAGRMRSDANVSVGGVVELDQVNIAGTSCVKNGNISRDALGATLSCQSGVWVLLGGGIGQTFYSAITSIPSNANGSVNPSKTTMTASFCSIAFANVGSRYGADTTAGGCRITNSGNIWTLTALGSDRTSQTTCQAVCIR